MTSNLRFVHLVVVLSQPSCSQKSEIRWTANLQPLLLPDITLDVLDTARDGDNLHAVDQYLDWFNGAEMVQLRGQAKLSNFTLTSISPGIAYFLRSQL